MVFEWRKAKMSQIGAVAQPMGSVIVVGEEEDEVGLAPYRPLEATDLTVTSFSRLPITVPVISTTATTAASKGPIAPVTTTSEDFLISDTELTEHLGSEEQSATGGSHASSHASSRASSHASTVSRLSGEGRVSDETPAVFVVTPHSVENVMPSQKPLEKLAATTVKPEQAASAIAMQEEQERFEDVAVVLPPSSGSAERQPARKKKWTRFFSFLRKRSSEMSNGNLRENARAGQQ